MWLEEEGPYVHARKEVFWLHLLPVRAQSLWSRLTLCDPMTVVHQAPLSMGFSRQEYYSG